MLGKVEICGVNTAKLPTLKSDEMTELLRRSHLGDERARETLIQGNLRLVLSVIQRFASRGENAGRPLSGRLHRASSRPSTISTSTQNVRFSTYGVPMIIGEIRRYLRDNSAIRVSRSMRDTAYRVLQAQGKAHSARTSVSRPSSRSPRSWTCPARRSCSPWTRWSIPVSLYEPVYSDGGDTVCVMDQVRDTQQHRRKLARPDRSARGGGQALAARAAHFSHALLRRQDADGGLRRDRHFAGAGLAAGEKRHQHHPQEPLTAS